MASLTGKKIANTYKDLLQVSNSNSGIDATLRSVEDGEGTSSPLQLSNSAVNINGTFKLNGTTLTASASVLNAVADLTGATGIVAVSGGTVYGRTLTAGVGLSITNADGTEGNPTFALNPSGVTSGTYGPFTNFEVNQYGQVVSAAAVSTSVSIPTLRADEIIGGTLALSSKASIVGDLNVDGATTLNSTLTVGSSVAVSGSLTADSGSFSSTVCATSFYGDGSNLTNLPTAPTSVSAYTVNDLYVINRASFTAPVSGSSASFTGTVSASNITENTDAITSINTVIDNLDYATSAELAAVSALTSVNTAAITSINTVIDNLDYVTSAELAAVSSALATSIATANARITSVSDYAVALSATFATSINNSNTNIAAVSALTSVNAAAITSINTVVDNLDFATSAELAAVSSALATSIATANSRITSVSDYAVALSATFATSINNSNTNIAAVSAITSVNAAAITSINTVVDNLDYATSAELAAVSSALATSISTANTRITSVSDYAVALSATFATSINNSNTNIAAVSALTSVNAAAITSINTVVDNLDFATSAELAAVSSALATSIATANSRITSVSDYAVALSATFATSINNSNTNIAAVSALTSVNAAAITSINTVIDGLDYATSAELAAVSSALATSISTANTRITSVSDYTVALSATMAASIANHLPLAGGTMTGTIAGFESTGIDDNAASTAMTIDSSQNVGIGTTNPSRSKLVIGATTPQISFTNTDGTSSTIDITRVSGPGLSFSSNSSEKMRLTSSGRLLLGKTATSLDTQGVEIRGDTTNSQQSWTGTNDLTKTLVGAGLGTSGNWGSHLFYFNNSSTLVGYISHNNSSTAYNTTSDYRLKENIVDLNGAIDRLKLLKPSRFNFIIDPDRTVDGFIAHEVSDVVPEAIHGEKDAVDAEGNPQYQGIDQGKLVPLLTAALKEAVEKIETLEDRVALLEGN